MMRLSSFLAKMFRNFTLLMWISVITCISRAGNSAETSTFDPLPLLPPQTLIAGETRDLGKLIAQFATTSAGKALKLKAVNDALRYAVQIPPHWQEFLRTKELEQCDAFWKVVDALPQSGTLCVALIDVEPPKSPEKSEIDWLVVWEPRDQKVDWPNTIVLGAEQIFKLPRHYGDLLQRKTTNPAGEKVVEWQYANRTVPLAVGTLDGCVLLSNTPALLTQFIADRQRDKAGVNAGPQGPKPEILRHVPSFVRAQGVFGVADLSVYANVASLLTHPQSFLTSHHKTAMDWQTISGVRSIQSAAMSLQITDGNFKERLFIDAPANERAGLLACFESESMGDATLQDASPRNTAVLGAQFDPKRFLAKLSGAIQKADPRVNSFLQAGFSLGLEQLHLNPQFLANLDGRISVQVDLERAPSVVLKLGIVNPESLAKALAAFRSNLKDNLEFIDTHVGESQIVTIRPKQIAFGMYGWQLAYSMKDKTLLLAPFPLCIKNELLRLAVPAAPPKLIAETSFQESRMQLPERVQSLLGINTAQLVESALTLGLPYLQTFGGEYAQFAAQWPDREISALPFSYTVAGMRIADDGFRLDCVGAAPLLNATAAWSIWDGLELSVHLRQYLSPSREQFKILQAALDSYSKDNKGAFPKNLDDLQPKYISVLPASYRYIEYRGRQEKLNDVVAHTNPAIDDLLTFILQDGTIVKHGAHGLSLILKQGFPVDRPAIRNKTKNAPQENKAKLNDDAVPPPPPIPQKK